MTETMEHYRCFHCKMEALRGLIRTKSVGDSIDAIDEAATLCEQYFEKDGKP